MQNAFLTLAAFGTGVLVPLQLAFNAQLGAVTRNAYTASLIVFLVGAVVLTALVLATRPDLPTMNDLQSAPRTVWLGGVIATIYIVAIVWGTPRLGIAPTAVLIIAGQLIMAVILDHFGAFGAQKLPFNAMKGLGVALVIAGVVAIRVA